MEQNCVAHKYAFTEGDIPISFCYRILEPIPKVENQGFREISLLKAIYKFISMIIHLRLITTIKLQSTAFVLIKEWRQQKRVGGK
jgi:hypothetical protein